MDLTSNFDKNINTLSKALRVGKSFDIIERSIIIGDKKATMYYIDGFVINHEWLLFLKQNWNELNKIT